MKQKETKNVRGYSEIESGYWNSLLFLIYVNNSKRTPIVPCLQIMFLKKITHGEESQVITPRKRTSHKKIIANPQLTY